MTLSCEVRWLRKAEFIKGCSRLAQFPAADASVEVAFAGRSNAGKSSVLNRLCDNRRLARVGKTPGRTREINLFAVPVDELPDSLSRASPDGAGPDEASPDRTDALSRQTMLADLPGYGYARVSQNLALGELLRAYLNRRQCLYGLVLVIDARRGLSEEDRQLLAIGQGRGIAVLPLLNKADKLSQAERHKALKSLGSAPALLCSARTGQGMEQLAQWVLAQIRLGLQAPNPA